LSSSGLQMFPSTQQLQGKTSFITQHSKFLSSLRHISSVSFNSFRHFVCKASKTILHAFHFTTSIRLSLN
jgi:hypothetical protein